MNMTFKKEDDVKLSVGDVAQLYCTQNDTFVKKSDGTVPLGIVIHTSDLFNDVIVDCSRQTVITSNFDVRQRYPLNASVYVNSEGQFTTVAEASKYAEAQIPSIGMVIKGPTAQCGTLTLIWF